MRKENFLAIAIITVFAFNISCYAQEAIDNESRKTNNVEVFYFHFTRRCATCLAVESVSREAVSELYGTDISFVDYNLDESEGESKGKELQVSGQALLIVKGETKIDITNEGFMNARTNPDKLKQVIKEKIDPLL